MRVEQKNIRLLAQLPNRSQRRRGFPKAEQTRNIRKPYRPPGQLRLHNALSLEVVNNNTGKTTLAIRAESHIDTGDLTHGTTQTYDLHARRQTLLQPDRGFRRHGPPVNRGREPHEGFDPRPSQYAACCLPRIKRPI